VLCLGVGSNQRRRSRRFLTDRSRTHSDLHCRRWHGLFRRVFGTDPLTTPPSALTSMTTSPGGELRRHSATRAKKTSGRCLQNTDLTLSRSFRAWVRPACAEVRGSSCCPWATAGDRCFPPVLARMWHAPNVRSGTPMPRGHLGSNGFDARSGLPVRFRAACL
jgi:hypothetical protein